MNIMSGPDVVAQAALARHWVEYRIGFRDETALARLAASPFAPLLQELVLQGRVLRSFFLRKQPGFRLRVLWAEAPASDPLLILLQCLAETTPFAFAAPLCLPPYRETGLFGGDAALAHVEAFFDADSAMVLALAAGDMQGASPAAISLELVGTLFRGIALDPWEIWALWTDLADLRGGPSPAPISPPPLEGFGPTMTLALAAAEKCAQALSALAATGGMTAPLRSVMPVVAAYHLNRMGFDAGMQAALATGAARHTDPHARRRVGVLMSPVAFERVALGPTSVFDLPGIDGCIRQRDVEGWRSSAAEVEMVLVRQAVSQPMRGSLVCRTTRPLDEAPAVLSRPVADHNRHDRRTVETVLNLVWRHCGNPVPFADMASTQIFDPNHPLQAAYVARSAVLDPDDCFSADRYDVRPAAALPSGISAALETAAAAFSLADAPTPAPEQLALATLLHAVGNGKPLRLDEADNRIAEIAVGRGLPAWVRDPVALGAVAAPWPDLPTCEPGGRLLLHPPLPSVGAQPGEAELSPRRVALRLQSAAGGVQLAFFGSDRMSWLARYLPRAHPMEASLRRAAADWLSHWPDMIDTSAGFSSHKLDEHAPLTLHDARLDPQRHWLQPASNGLYELADRDGRPVHAVHFGVSTPASLAPVAQLALLARARRPSWGEWVLGAFNQRILQQIASAGTMPFAVAGVDLGGPLHLPGPACVLPAGAAAIAVAAKGNPTALWDMLGQLAGAAVIGPVVLRCLPGGESRIVDLRLPAGLATLYRMARRGNAQWLLIDPLARSTDGKPSSDLYIEIAAEADRLFARRSPGWISQQHLMLSA